jgi:hypothetical protein
LASESGYNIPDEKAASVFKDKHQAFGINIAEQLKNVGFVL